MSGMTNWLEPTVPTRLIVYLHTTRGTTATKHGATVSPDWMQLGATAHSIWETVKEGRNVTPLSGNQI
eukprot:1735806-Rhodomonas_salina.1